jgi:subtilisin family serine protease
VKKFAVKLFIYSLLSASTFPAQFTAAQVESVYWVQFDSKSQNLFLPANTFLSPRAIERRQRQNIGISENDYPVYEPYKQAVAALADSVIHTLKWFNSITIVLKDSSTLPQIRSLSFVKNVQKLNIPLQAPQKRQEKLNYQYKQALQIAENSVYGIARYQTEMLRVDRLHQAGLDGKNVLIAVFDNGFEQVDTISAFKHLFDNTQLKYHYNYVDRKSDVFDEGTHGTVVLSCIAAYQSGVFVGVAPKSDIALFKTENNFSETILEEFNWAEAAEKADSLGADIFTTSLGYSTFQDGFADRTYFDMNGDKTIITQASNIAFSKGILVLTSAGNQGETAWRFITAPADGRDVLAVGAVDEYGKLANFSSRGPNSVGQVKPDVCAQGKNVAVLNELGKPATSSGTSFSCPLIAGAAACLWQSYPQLSAKELKELILQSAHLYQQPNNDYGYGIPNFYKAWLLNSDKKKLPLQPAPVVVFPNPFDNNLNVFFKNQLNGEAEITVADMTGKVVFKKEIQVFENDVQLLEVEAAKLWNAGCYLLRVQSPSTIITKQVVKTDR